MGIGGQDVDRGFDYINRNLPQRLNCINNKIHPFFPAYSANSPNIVAESIAKLNMTCGHHPCFIVYHGVDIFRNAPAMM